MGEGSTGAALGVAFVDAAETGVLAADAFLAGVVLGVACLTGSGDDKTTGFLSLSSGGEREFAWSEIVTAGD